MTNLMRFTPPSDHKIKVGTHKWETVQARDIALRGNMGSANFQERGSGKATLSRTETIRNVKASRPETMTIPPRIARVSRKPSLGGFHVVGLGNVKQVSLGELKEKLGVSGFTGYRIGKQLFTLTGKKAVLKGRAEKRLVVAS